MLQSIHVKNFALIDEVEIDLTNGLNAITGETGAGKSIIIDAVNFALGKRMPRDVVRDDAEYALSELVFSIETDEIRNKLNELEIENEDDLIILSRKIVNGRNSCKVNGESVTTGTLKQLSSLLIDIHGQHEHQSLLNKAAHMELIDSCLDDSSKKILAKISQKYKDYLKLQTELKEALNEDLSRERDIEFATFEIKEIKDAKLTPNEDEELENAYCKMSNAKKIAESVTLAHRMTGYDGDGAGNTIGRAVALLKNASSYDSNVEDMLSMLTDIDSILNEFNKSIADYEESLNFSEEDFIECESRLNQINGLKSKYGSSIDEILKYLEKREADVLKYEDFDSYISKLKNDISANRSEIIELCKTISNKRAEIAKKLSAEIKDALMYLNFLDANFEIRVTPDEDAVTGKGFDNVEMFISTNPGERPRPLSEVASGGEISRIMLAIKSVLASRDNIPTLIFDEIDTGISGRTAQKVSEKISIISREHQVLLVTHLPQIAAMADTHFEISKSVTDGRTATSVKKLTENEQIKELSRMLSGAEITDSVIQSAKEMKQLANEIKH